MKIAIAQINTTPSDFEGNFNRISEFTLRAIEEGADMIVFPELALSGYQNQDIIFSPEFIRENELYLKKIKGLSKGIAIVIGHITARRATEHTNRYDRSSLRFGGRYIYYNSASVFFNRRLIHTYHKQRLPSFDVFNEERYFSGGLESSLFEFRGLKIGINICEDIWYEPGPYEQEALKGANIIINISASPFYYGKPEIRLNMIQRKAKRYKVFTIYANSVGGQDDVVYDGNSFVFDRKGRLIAKGKAFEEELFIVETEKESEEIRPKFEKEEVLFKAIVTGIRDYFYKNGIRKAVVGLSGGVDSALVSTLSWIALGKENIINLFMPSDFTSDESKDLVDEFIKRQKAALITIPISNAYKTLLGSFDNLRSESTLPYENLQSRLRGSILMFVANVNNAAVLATGNKNEISLGYNTLYGDTVGAIAPIGDLYKNEVIDLCNYINKTYGNLIPEDIINRVPTAELRKNQKDEDDLPPYSVTNRLLFEMIENNRTDSELIRMGFEKGVIEFVHRAIKRSEFKRRQMPPIIKLKQKSFGFGRRVPITHKFPYIR